MLNEQLHVHDVLFAKSSMIRCALSLDVDCVRHINQLDPHLQDIAELCHVNYSSLRDLSYDATLFSWHLMIAQYLMWVHDEQYEPNSSKYLV